MLAQLLDRLACQWPIDSSGAVDAGLLLRAALAGLLALAVGLVFGKRQIAWLRARFREPILGDSATLNELHRSKRSTPTMGGLFIVAEFLLATLLLGQSSNVYLWLAVMLVVGLATIGAVDDLTKIRGLRNGLSVRAKLAAQIGVAVIVAWLVYRQRATIAGGLDLTIPFVGSWSLGWLFVPWAALVIVASSNAVNLTDGLDGLAANTFLSAGTAMAIIAFVVGSEYAGSLGVTHISAAAEMVPILVGMLGAVFAFLVFNRHPAKVFMGDVGSLPLGGLLGLAAVITRQEFIWALVGGVFVAEATSVVIQVGWFKLSGRRVFRCVPLHHHFQFLGWPEQRVVQRFCGVGCYCMAIGMVLFFFQGTQRHHEHLARVVQESPMAQHQQLERR